MGLKKVVLSVIACLVLCVVATAIYTYVILKPSNDKNWEAGFIPLPKISKQGTVVTVNDFRDMYYQPGNYPDYIYGSQSFNAASITAVWLVIQPFSKNPAVAHTYFVFDFSDRSPVAVSVEARREKGEKYNTWLGMANKFELIYVWSTETDQLTRRVMVDDNKLYMYPLQISDNAKQQLFLQLADRTHELETRPRFYNTLASNCTNELAKTANSVKKGAIPFDIALFLPGYSLNLLYKLGYVPTDIPLSELPGRFYISDTVRNNFGTQDVSAKVRASLIR